MPVDIDSDPNLDDPLTWLRGLAAAPRRRAPDGLPAERRARERRLNVGIVTPGFEGRRRESAARLPPGQYLTGDFPVLSAGPTPRVALDQWEFVITTETGQFHHWSWSDLMALPSETPSVDIHCVTKWSKLDTNWEGASLDTLMRDVETAADFALAGSYGGYTTNLPLEDLLDGKAWIAYRY